MVSPFYIDLFHASKEWCIFNTESGVLMLVKCTHAYALKKFHLKSFYADYSPTYEHLHMKTELVNLLLFKIKYQNNGLN
jgi:hypothetical protein